MDFVLYKTAINIERNDMMIWSLLSTHQNKNKNECYEFQNYFTFLITENIEIMN